jgi:integrase/recombinase XerD
MQPPAWRAYLSDFEAYLLLERGMSQNTIEAYLRDMQKLAEFAELKAWTIQPPSLTQEHLEEFLQYLHELGVGERTQARIISGIKAFYKYLLLTDAITHAPTDRLDAPNLGRELPTVLSLPEINEILTEANLEANEMLRLRNTAILEVLYACGLRVSELVELRLSHIFWEMEIIKVRGKGNKERLVPIGEQALAALRQYLTADEGRITVKKQAGEEDIVFLNRRGKRLSRNMVFMLVQKWAAAAGIQKTVSPHTFRHSFATHLIEGGADLRAIQEMLGHESITTTEIYTHLDMDFLRGTIQLYHPRNR